MKKQDNLVAVCAFCGHSIEVVGRDESSRIAVKEWAKKHEHCAVEVGQVAS